MIKKLKLDENYSIELRRFEGGKQIWLVDNTMNQMRMLAFLTEGFRWEQVSHDFFEIVKKNPSVFINNLFKPLEDPHEASVDTKLSCFKRRFNIKLNRTINKIKHI
jgi:hypothetical protein